MFSSLTIVLTYVVLALPAAAIGIPWAWLTGNIGLLYRWSMWILRTGVRLARIRVEVAGREHIPNRPCIFMANHVSNLDPPILFPELPFRTAFFLKRSLMKIPILGLGMRLADFVPVDRDGRLESARESVKVGNRVLGFRGQHLDFSGGHALAQWQAAAFQEGAFLPRHGIGQAGHSRFHPGIRTHDDERQPAHQAGHRARHFPPAGLPGAICHP
jgi:1-acyl-sn-glycerol-3-phosphate acyltransferase